MGKIGITLQIAGGRVQGLHIGSRDTEAAASAFAGMQALEVPRRLGQIYTLCSRAQTIAALGAIEAALGMRTDPGVQAARDVLRRSEMLSQVAMRLALHWPRALDLPPDPTLPRKCLAAERALEAALFGQSPWRVPGAGRAATDISDAAQEIERLGEAVKSFAAETGLRGSLAEAGLENFGALTEGMAPEGGSFARRWEAPTVVQARAAHGPGLAARLEAGFAELVMLPGEMRAALDLIAPAAPMPAQRLTGKGEAVVDTARGPLAHRVEIAGGRVTAYAVDAPTEVNFRPGGPVEVGLLGAAAEGLEKAAALHVLAIDPCVEFELDLTDA